MTEVRFCVKADNRSFKYAVIIARYKGKWVFCKHRQRDTYECPGGHREPGEAILDTAKRELWEETGALEYALRQIAPYSVSQDGDETFGMLYFAEISRFGPLPEMEMERIELFETPPEAWTYPIIQKQLFEEVRRTL